MPKGSPFTRMCQLLGRPRHAGRVDMHLHTTASDGSYTPAQLLDISRRSGFSAIAVTDHDTIDGALLASRLRRVGDPVVIIGAELSITWHGRDLHLLAYGADPTHGGYCQGLADLRQRRAGACGTWLRCSRKYWRACVLPGCRWLITHSARERSPTLRSPSLSKL